MKKPIRNLLLLLLAAVVIAPPVAYWAVDGWLESSGGREMLEKNLAKRTGMKVRLGGEFDLMLLPDIGVSGTDLVIESPLSDDPLARSAEYEISVALKPLFDGLVQIDWIRLSGGEIYPHRYAGSQAADDTGDSRGVRLPEIQELSIRNFKVVLPGAGNEELTVKVLEISDFADRRSAPFLLEIQDLLSARGRVLLDLQESRLDLQALSLERSGQRLTGDACMIIGEPFSIHLVLKGERVDFDLLRKNLPGSDAWAGESAQESNTDLRVRVSVDELVAAGAVARGVVLSLGQEPVCGSD